MRDIFQTKINHHIVGSTYVFGMVSTMHRESYHTFNSIRSLGRGVCRTGILIPTHVNVSLENQILDISLEFKTMGLSIAISFGKLDEIHFFSTDTIRCSELVHSSLKSCSLALRQVLFPGVMVMHDQGPEQGSGNEPFHFFITGQELAHNITKTRYQFIDHHHHELSRFHPPSRGRFYPSIIRRRLRGWRRNLQHEIHATKI